MEKKASKSLREADFPEVGARIFEFLGKIGISSSFVARTLGKTQAAISAVKNGVNDAKLDIVLWTVRQGCDAHWLLTGEGEMQNLPKMTMASEAPKDDALEDVNRYWRALTRHERAAIADLINGAQERIILGRWPGCPEPPLTKV